MEPSGETDGNIRSQKEYVISELKQFNSYHFQNKGFRQQKIGKKKNSPEGHRREGNQSNKNWGGNWNFFWRILGGKHSIYLYGYQARTKRRTVTTKMETTNRRGGAQRGSLRL